MAQFLLVYNGPGPKPEDDVTKIRSTAGVVVVNDRFPTALIVRTDSDLTEKQLARFPGWSIKRSKTVTLDEPSSASKRSMRSAAKARFRIT